MIVAFVLSMPGNNSWNGRWSGDGKLYARLKTFRGVKQEKKAAELIAHGAYGYDFGDGWYAQVEVREVTAGESCQIRKNSQGFCGYEWMIDSILDCGKIFASHQSEQRSAWIEAQKATPAAVVAPIEIDFNNLDGANLRQSEKT